MCCASSEGDVWSSAEAAGAAGAEQSCGGAAGAGGARGARPESLWSGSAEADGSSAGGHDQLWTPGSDQCVSTRRDRQVRAKYEASYLIYTHSNLHVNNGQDACKSMIRF